MKRFIMCLGLLALNFQFSTVNSLFACTNLIVGKKASKDGSVIISYSQDSYGSNRSASSRPPTIPQGPCIPSTTTRQATTWAKCPK